MKLTRKEFEDQLKLAKSLPTEARAAMLATLKAATVVEVKEVDGKSVETPVTVEIVENEPAAKATLIEGTAALAPKGLSDEDVTRLAKAIAAEHKAAPVARKVGAVDEPKDGEPAKKFTIPAQVKRFGAVKNFARADVGGLKSDERAYRFGMWALAAMGRPHAKTWCAEHGISLDVDRKAQSEGSNAAGGFLVPAEFGTDMIDLREQYGVVRRLFKIRPMSSDTRTDPRRVSGLTANFTNEGTAGSESTKAWDNVSLTAKKLVVLSRMSNEVNEDAVINVGDDLAGEISYAFTLKEDTCGFVGAGGQTHGGISGVTTALSNKWSTGTAGVGYGLVKQGTSTTWGAIVIGDFDNVVGSLPQYADNANTVWAMHRAFYYSVVEKLVQASGGVPAMEVRTGQRAPRPLFKGYPVEFSQVMPSTTASAQVSALLGDFTQGASFGDRRLDSIAFSDSATIGGESVFERDQIAIRGTERFDINVHDVGSGTAGETGPIIGLITG